jgi:hypothetical protein
LVYNSWNSYGQSEYDLHKKDEQLYDVNDIIGFAPNNSISENFDYKSFQYYNSSTG